MISVVIPNFNDPRITRAVASVRKQSYRNYELVIVDGGSTDGRVITFYETSGCDKLVREKDGGIFDGLNKGVRLVSGDVVFLMGADDELSDERVFEDVMEKLEKDPSLDGVCIGCQFVNARGTPLRTWYPTRVSAAWIKRGLLPPHFSLFLRKVLYDLVGEFKYREYGNVACDILWLMDLAILKSDLRVRVLPGHHLRMEYGGASTGSLAAVLNQFLVVHRYARANARHLRGWYLYSLVRTLSKVSQFSPTGILGALSNRSPRRHQ